ncbi:hypothetical protein [Kitasatospora sp. NPDC096140]|uniref:hypothetical protein n=1 Tax=unclassified Kitasatospora TaxID=2633591 RepID=UPI00331ED64A
MPADNGAAPADPPRKTGLDAQFSGLPAELKTGGTPVEFSVILTDRTGKALAAASPSLVLSGRGITSTLSRLDPATGTWLPDSATDTGAAPIGVDPTAASYAVPAGGSLTIRYRIAVSAGSRPQQSRTSLSVVGADGSQLAAATQSVALTAG